MKKLLLLLLLCAPLAHAAGGSCPTGALYTNSQVGTSFYDLVLQAMDFKSFRPTVLCNYRAVHLSKFQAASL